MREQDTRQWRCTPESTLRRTAALSAGNVQARSLAPRMVLAIRARRHAPNFLTPRPASGRPVPKFAASSPFAGAMTSAVASRSTSEAAVNEVKKEIARRNEEAQKAGRKRRAAREKEQLANLRKWERL